MKKLFFGLLCGGLLTGHVCAQGYEIKLHVKKMAGQEVILAHYLEGNVYAVDTARLDAAGTGVFKKENRKLARGMYLIRFSPSNYPDLIIGDDQHFTVTTDTLDYLNTMKIEGSPENAAFLEFQQFMVNLNQKMLQAREAFEKETDKNEAVREKYNAIFENADREVRTYIDGIGRKFPGSSLATFTNFTLSPDVPDFSAEVPEGTEDREMEIRRKAFFYAKDHFWDHTNFTDSMLIRTPIFKKKLDDYFANWVIVHPDSLYQSCVQIIEKARPDKTMFRYLLNYCINASFEHKIMGMDEAFVKLGQRYFMKKGEIYWLDEEALKKITDEVIKRQYNLIGQKGLDLQLPTLEGHWTSLYETQAPYTLLLFWEPNCGHCKKTVPSVKKEIYDVFAPLGLKVFAVMTQTDKKDWEEFVEKYELFDFINTWDPNRQSNYWTIYNVFTTPVIYLLDKDKKIIAKNLTTEQIVDLLKREYNKQGHNFELSKEPPTPEP
ncbi:MAG: DUF5106 domain-containing protein [Culturomica sp.]|jgi:peroxiredoxin|nr:DUF5106 domain-containing protein [Culturomica sp.]